jgi:diguanylate cyclase (GGDEF)-like protein
MNQNTARKTKDEPAIVRLDDFRSVDELAGMLSSCTRPEEAAATVRDFASEYSRLYLLAQRLAEENKRMRESPDEKNRTIEMLTNEMWRLREELYETREKLTVDELTGASRKFVAMIHGPELVAQANRYGLPLSFVMIDVDDFKGYNDRYGHVQGDKALATVAHEILQNKREADILIRYGGEEFLLMLPNTDQKGAFKYVDELRQKIEKAVIPTGDERYIKCRDGRHAHKTVCAGIFTYDRSLNESLGFNCEDDEIKKLVALIGLADKALYSAKEFTDETGKKPKNSVSVYQM